MHFRLALMRKSAILANSKSKQALLLLLILILEEGQMPKASKLSQLCNAQARPGHYMARPYKETQIDKVKFLLILDDSDGKPLYLKKSVPVCKQYGYDWIKWVVAWRRSHRSISGINKLAVEQMGFKI
jgi:hypothetical protein